MSRHFPPNTQPEWMQDLQPGDVLVDHRGNYRVVRKASYWRDAPDKRLWGVTLSIQRCSWTGRPYTVLYWCDLISRGYTKVAGVRVKLQTELDRRLAEAINDHNNHELTCCGVRGVV